MQNSFSKLKEIFVFLYLAGSMGLFSVLFIENSPTIVEVKNNTLFSLCWILFYSLSLIYFLIEIKKGITHNEVMIFIIPIVFITQSFFSYSLSKSFVYSVMLLLNSFFSFVLFRTYSIEELINLVKKTILVLVLFSLLLWALNSNMVMYFDIHERESLLGLDPIRGLFNHKITAGFYAVFALIAVLYIDKGLKKLLYSIILLFFILMTGSSSAVALLIVGILLSIYVNNCLKNNISAGLFIFVAIFFIVISFLIYFTIGTLLLEILGRDATLTGRTLLWSWGLDVSLERPIFGWGYVGYNGTELASYAASQFTEFQNYDVPHFHNSYIQYLVEAGWIFGVLIILLHCTVPYFTYKAVCKNKCVHLRLITIYMMLLLFSSLFIHNLGRYNNLNMILFFYTIPLFSYLSALKLKRYNS